MEGYDQVPLPKFERCGSSHLLVTKGKSGTFLRSSPVSVKKGYIQEKVQV